MYIHLIDSIIDTPLGLNLFHKWNFWWLVNDVPFASSDYFFRNSFTFVDKQLSEPPPINNSTTKAHGNKLLNGGSTKDWCFFQLTSLNKGAFSPWKIDNLSIYIYLVKVWKKKKKMLHMKSQIDGLTEEILIPRAGICISTQLS